MHLCSRLVCENKHICFKMGRRGFRGFKGRQNGHVGVPELGMEADVGKTKLLRGMMSFQQNGGLKSKVIDEAELQFGPASGLWKGKGSGTGPFGSSEIHADGRPNAPRHTHATHVLLQAQASNQLMG